MTSIEETLAITRENERKRIGHVYEECIRRGCKCDFLKAFDARMSINPLGQTQCFLDSKILNRFRTDDEKKMILQMWYTYLEVYNELKQDERTGQRKEAIKLMRKAKENGVF